LNDKGKIHIKPSSLMLDNLELVPYQYKDNRDSSFPFQPNDELVARIENQKVIIEKRINRSTANDSD